MMVGKKTATISFKIRTKDDYKVKASDFNAPMRIYRKCMM